MGVPRKMSESHWGTYFICPFRCSGFFGGSRMSSKMVSLHFPESTRRQLRGERMQRPPVVSCG